MEQSHSNRTGTRHDLSKKKQIQSHEQRIKINTTRNNSNHNNNLTHD